jgi:hypothetical protein
MRMLNGNGIGRRVLLQLRWVCWETPAFEQHDRKVPRPIRGMIPKLIWMNLIQSRSEIWPTGYSKVTVRVSHSDRVALPRLQQHHVVDRGQERESA